MDPIPNIDLEPQTDTKLKQTKLYVIFTILLIGVFVVGYVAGSKQVKIQTNSGKIEITKGNAPSTSADYSLLWEALDLLNKKYVDRPLDQQKLMYGAVEGLVSATGDPYTSFFNPDEAQKFTEQLRGSFDGIGAELGMQNGQLVIVAPLDDTPAQKAGILAGDAIIEIDGQSTQGVSIDQAVSKIRGAAGTQVKLTIVHKEKREPVELTITRSKIIVQSVKFSVKDNGNKKIAVIKINQFGDDTKGLFDQAIDSYMSGSYSGLILDLRNNPGGYLDTAVSTISNWVDPNMVAVKEIGFGNDGKDYKTSGVPRLKNIKTVILVNEGSASAAEIVSGALQDYKAATLVGNKTFGKGSVQELENLKEDSEIKITVAKWYTPNGRGIDKKGLEPDIKIDLTEDDIKNNKDPQMDKALEILK